MNVTVYVDFFILAMMKNMEVTGETSLKALCSLVKTKQYDIEMSVPLENVHISKDNSVYIEFKKEIPWG